MLHLLFTNDIHIIATPQTSDPDYPETWNFYDDSGDPTPGFVVYDNKFEKVERP
jgi:hypothetical protein